MAQTVEDVMTRTTLTLGTGASVQEAAEVMAENDIGDVIVCDGDTIYGIVTDRDIVVRSTARGRVPAEVELSEVASTDLVTLAPTDTIRDAVALVRDRAVRRIPVVEDGKPVGIVSLGDLAIERDDRSALADVSAAESNT